MADTSTTRIEANGTSSHEVYELYVGYLPVPPGIRRFLRWSVPTVLWVSCIACVAWATTQRDPGPAVWEDTTPQTIEGVLVAKPYPMVFLDVPAGQPIEDSAVLLVEMGKHGGATRAAKFDGKRVRVVGFPLHRDGRRMFELQPTPESVTEVAGSVMRLETPVSLGPATLHGEIMDSKCFLGAMKPGEGKTHKACATLCIKGGIPPMLVTRDAGGAPVFYLLTDPSGNAVSDAVYPLIGEPVVAAGEVMSWRGMKLLRISPEDVRRP